MLIGTAFPQASGSWVAVLSIDDQPLRVVSNYLAQAAAHGLHTSPQCMADYPRGRTYTQEPLDDVHRPRAGAQAVTCTASTDTTNGGSWWYLFVHWGTLYDRTVSFTSAYMEYKPTHSGPSVPTSHAPRTMPTMRSWRRPATPAQGQRFDGDYAGLNIGRRPGLYVVPGSRLAAPVADTNCGTGGMAAVLENTGGEDVVHAYAEQMADNEFPPGPPRPIPGGDGATVLTGQVAGGGDLSLTQVTRQGKRWLLILRCGD